MMDASRSEEPRSHKRKLALWSALGVVAIVGAIGVAAATGLFAGQAAPQPATASVPPTPSAWPTPTPGSTEAPEPVAEETVPLDEAADFGDSVTGRVVALERFTAEGGVPGEPTGDAVRVTVEITNSGRSPVDTKGATITATFGEGALPGAELEMDSSGEFPDIIRPGASVTVVRAFAIPSDSGSLIRVSLDLLAGKPVVGFEGVVPKV